MSGVLLPGMEGVILRPDGTHCVPNEPGELYVKGDNVTLGTLPPILSANATNTVSHHPPASWQVTGITPKQPRNPTFRVVGSEPEIGSKQTPEALSGSKIGPRYDHVKFFYKNLNHVSKTKLSETRPPPFSL